MKKTSITVSILLIFTLLLSACTWPFAPAAPAPSIDQAVAATLTALFNPANLPPGETPQPTSNAIELPTLVPPTDTLTPEPTGTFTPEPSATFTSGPTSTSTTPPTAAPSNRPNAQLTAMYLSTPPVQDGTYAEWVEKTNKYSMSNFAWGKSNWANHADAEGVYALAWDNTNLYVGVKVTDDTYTQNNTGAMLYVGDAIEILLDTDLLGDFYTTSFNSDDYHLGLSAGNPSTGLAPEAYLWNPSSVKGSRTQVTISRQFESATIYRLEAAIPWSLFGVTPHKGMRMGFAICLDDADNTNDYDKVTMLSSASGLAVFNPTTWGELVLAK